MAGQMGCAALTTPGVAGDATAATAPAGYGPLDLRYAYATESSSLTGGVGQTVAVVTAYDDATAETDMGTYRSEYHIRPCASTGGCFTKVDENGGTNYPPAGAAGWSLATAQALDMISAICPNCHILLVEADTTAITDLGQAENEAVTLGAKFVTNTFFTAEATYGTSEPTYDTDYFDHPGVAITAPDGNGAGYGVSYPAASPDVIAVGGTTLTRASGTVRGWTETTWSGTGSGCSAYEAKPSWQADTGCTSRMLNDVSAVADPVDSPIAFYDTSSGDWVEGGGDNVAAAIIAAMLALGGAPAAGSSPAAYLYAHPGLFNDITTGSNGTCAPSPAYFCTAGTGYDGPTGLGTPAGALGAQAPASTLPSSPVNFDPATGNIEVYAVSSSRALEQDAWNSATGWAGWAGWKSLGGSTLAGRPAAIFDPASGNLEVYARETSGALVEDYWVPGTGWSGLVSMGSDKFQGNPVAVYDPDRGALEVYATGTTGTVFEDSWTTAGGWTGWQNRGGELAGGPAAAFDPASGNLELYGAGTNGALEQDVWKPGTGWTGWLDQGGSGVTGTPAVAYNPLDDGVAVFVDESSRMYEDSWTHAGGWTGLQSLGAGTFTGPGAAYNPVSGGLQVYGVGGTGTVFGDSWTPTAGWTGWQNRSGDLAGGPAGGLDPASGNFEVYGPGANAALEEDALVGITWSGWADLGGSLYDL
jgi:hypothetical protein